MKRYDNGEIVTKKRIEDEKWYGNYYQPFLTIAMGSTGDVDDLYEDCILFFSEVFDEELSGKNKKRMLRWAVLHIERAGGQYNFE